MAVCFRNWILIFPRLDGEPLRINIEEMSGGFGCSGISPVIFVAEFESMLNSETRHSGGMHYISINNIYKVIDPLRGRPECIA